MLPFTPRQVKIGAAAAFVGTTPRAIRHYHQIGLLPEPERGSDDRRRYGYEDMIRLLWIRTMADAGIALSDIRDAVADAAPSDAENTRDITVVLERLDRSLEAQEEELRRQRSAVRRMRVRGSRMGLLSDLVAERLAGAPDGSLRQDDLDTLLVTERIFGELGAAVQAGRFIALARHPELRKESDRVDAAEKALDDTVAVDDPRVAQVAAERHRFEQSLLAVIEASGQNDEDGAMFDAWDAAHPEPTVGGGEAGRAAHREPGSMSALEAIGTMPYDFSPARARCMELALALSLESDVSETAAP